MSFIAAAFMLLGMALLTVALTGTGALRWVAGRRPRWASSATGLAASALGVQWVATMAVGWESGGGIAELAATVLCSGLGLAAVRAWRAQIRPCRRTDADRWMASRSAP